MCGCVLFVVSRLAPRPTSLLISITGLRDTPAVIISGALEMRELVSITIEKANIDLAILVKQILYYPLNILKIVRYNLMGSGKP